MILSRRLFGWSAAATVAAAAAPAAAADEPPFVIERSAVLHVEAAGRRWRLMVAWPDGAPPPAGWPVLYVLDGDDNFAAAVATARRLAAARARSGVAPGIVVGVASEDLARRVLDYTPPTPGWTIPAGAPAAGLTTGGADAFRDVLRDRIQPLVQQRWRGDPNRQALLGHSFGGLLALHILYTRPNQFRTYLAVSPSLWFGGDILADKPDAGRKTGDRIPSVLLAGADDPRAPRGGPTLDTVALDLQRKGVAVRRLPLPGLSHGSTLFAALADAVALAFSA